MTELARTLPGFEHISRYWDDNLKVVTARIQPGELYVSRHDEMINTVLGSCISACISDLSAGIGGMNHFMLPDEGTTGSGFGAQAARYGLHAMEQLINTIMKHGGDRRNLQVKIFGGGRMIAKMGDVGARNIKFIHNYLREEGLSILAEDVGAIYPRKVNYFPLTGRVLMKRLRPLHNQTIADREIEVMQKQVEKPRSHDVEFFN